MCKTMNLLFTRLKFSSCLFDKFVFLFRLSSILNLSCIHVRLKEMAWRRPERSNRETNQAIDANPHYSRSPALACPPRDIKFGLLLSAYPTTGLLQLQPSLQLQLSDLLLLVPSHCFLPSFLSLCVKIIVILRWTPTTAKSPPHSNTQSYRFWRSALLASKGKAWRGSQPHLFVFFYQLPWFLLLLLGSLSSLIFNWLGFTRDWCMPI